MRLAAFASLIALCAACGTTLTAAGSRVTIVRGSAASGFEIRSNGCPCLPVARVASEAAHWWTSGFARRVEIESALTELRNQAGGWGATHVVLMSSATDDEMVEAKAFYCPGRPLACDPVSCQAAGGRCNGPRCEPPARRSSTGSGGTI